jgi:hypothetical protein
MPVHYLYYPFFFWTCGTVSLDIPTDCYANVTLDNEFEHMKLPNARTPPLAMLKDLC